MKKKTIAASLTSLALCASLVTGATYALFTSESETNIAITAGKVEVVAEVTDLALYSQEDINVNTLVGTKIDVEGNTFPNGGTATYADGTLTLDRLTPGDGVDFNISVTNKSNVAIMYRTVISSAIGNGLINALDVEINETEYAGEAVLEWTAIDANVDIDDISVSIELPTTAGNAYQNKTVELSIAIEAVQGNAVEVVDKWDGNAVETLSDDNVIDTAAELAGFAAAVNAGDDFAGKTVTLNSNINLDGMSWTPISSFAGTFDGQGYTISNLAFVYENSAKDTPVRLGLFDTVAATGMVKNLTLRNVSANLTLSGEAETSTSYYNFGAIAALLDGKAEDCVVKNVALVAEGQLANSGGVFGKATDGAVIDGCSAEGVTITVTDKFNKSGRADCIGGFIGVANSADATNKVKITDCSATNVTIDAVYKTRSYGGFVGCTVYTEMENCIATNVEMNIADYYQQVGGFVGYSKYGCVFTNCDVNGIIMNLNNDTKYECYVGGFIGHTDVPKAELSAVPDDQEKIVLEDCDVDALYITVSGLIYGRVSGFCGWTTGYGPTLATNCSVAGTIDAINTTIPKPESAGVMEIWRSLHANDAWTDSTANVTIIKD